MSIEMIRCTIFRPMKKAFLILQLLILSCSVHAQQPLTLEESVLGQFKQFYPEQLSQLNWLPETDNYVFVRNDSLLIGTIKGKTLKSITRAELSSLVNLESELKAFPAITWTGSTQFFFENDNEFVHVDMKQRKVISRTKQPQEAENGDYHPASGNFAFTRENNLYVLSEGKESVLTKNEPGVVSGQSISRNEYGISKGTFWNDAGTGLAFYEKDERNVTDYPLTNYKETPATVRMIKYPMAGGASEIVGVGVYQLSSGKTVYLDLFGANRKSDNFYATNLSWSPDGKWVFVVWLNRATNQAQLRQFDALTGKEIRVVLTESDDRWMEPLQPITFVKGSTDQYLWYSWKDGFHNYYLYQLNGKLIGKTNAAFELEEIIGFDEKGKTMYVAGRGENPTERHAYSVSLPTMEMSRLTPSAGTHSIAISKSGYVLDSYSSITVPNRVELSKGGRKILTLLEAEDKLKNYAIGTTEVFSINGIDGTELYCRMLKPSDFNPSEKYPVVVYVYNGPHIQLVTNSWLGGASLWMNYLAEQGYIVFTLDGRGSHHRGKEFEQATHRRLGDVEIDDQAAGVKWLHSQPWVDRDRMGIHGWSYGGFMTTSMMLRTPGLFKVGVAGGPVIDWNLYEVMYTERYMDTPAENPEGYSKADLTGYVKNLQGDLLLIHGTDDDVVVMQHNMKFLKACVDQNIPVDFFAYPGHGHNVRGKDRVHLMTKVIEYLTEKLAH